MIAFAHALLRNNDEVIVSAPASGAAAIAEAGLDHHPIPDPPEEERTPIFDRARTLAADDANALVVGDLFVRIDARAAFPHLRAAIERWRPDVVLYDMADFAAGLAAEATGVPAVTVNVSPTIHLQRLMAPIAEALDEVRAEVGLDPDRGSSG
jgi:UDP:flavonoid glycosyltransferase YjiC (YdhE family)